MWRSSRWWRRCSAIRASRRTCRTATCAWPAGWWPRLPVQTHGPGRDAVAGAARRGAGASARQAGLQSRGRHARQARWPPAAIAIYHNALRDLVTWHGVVGTLEELPATPDLRVLGGRRYAMHYKGSTTIVFWEEGPILMAVTSALPAEHVMAIAVGRRRATLIQSARRAAPERHLPSMPARQLRWGLLARPASTAH